MIRIRSPKDFWSGIFFIAVALSFIALSTQYTLGNMHRMGPALFPIIVSAMLGMIGLAIAIRGLAVDGPPVPPIQARPILITITAIFLFGFVLQHFGLIAAIAVLVILGGYASRESRLFTSIMLAAVLIVFSERIFVWLLGLPIPRWPGE